MKYYSISEFAKVIGKTEQTLRNWNRKNGYVELVLISKKKALKDK